MDDLGAVLIIAVFYTAQLSIPWLVAAAAVFGLLLAANRLRVKRLWPYLLLGLALWFCVYKSGVHATVAGVLLALTIPITPSPGRPDDAHSPLHRLEHALSPWVAFGVVPLFGFANAGVSFAGVTPALLLAPVPAGIAAALLVGKPLGIFTAAWLAIRLGWAEAPERASGLQLLAVSVLCGIGFTMSLFIGILAFPGDETLQAQLKVGVLAGSLASAVLGAGLLAVSRAVPRGNLKNTS